MSVNKDFLLNALLKHNYLPAQSKPKLELPPVVASTSFTPAVAERVATDNEGLRRGTYQGYDSVEYRLTRFNGVSRSCSVPHPAAYADLSVFLRNHWEKVDYIAANEISIIRPREHGDGRVIIMDYEDIVQQTSRTLENTFGKRFMVHTDIANFYPSLYSHAIPWATAGFSLAKRQKSGKKQWFNQLDTKVRALRRNETSGVSIGPATSNIACETILARVDGILLDEEYLFVRFIDDYRAYCRTEDEAQKFIRRLSEELGKYHLLLSPTKTEIIALPVAPRPEWVTSLSLALPTGKEVAPHDAINYFNLAVRIAKETPDGSVLKYALKSLLNQALNYEALSNILAYAINLSCHQPVLLPLLDPVLADIAGGAGFQYAKEIQHLAQENARCRRSDGTAWSLYYLNRYGAEITEETATAVLGMRDCMALILLFRSGDDRHQKRVLEFAMALDWDDLYELDTYWLLLYELYVAGKINNPYPDEVVFEVMRDSGVTFATTLEAT